MINPTPAKPPKTLPTTVAVGAVVASLLELPAPEVDVDVAVVEEETPVDPTPTTPLVEPVAL